MKDVKLEDIVSLAKRRGFIYQGSDIYGGLAGTWDYGPLGVQLKRNIMNLWWKMFVDDADDMYGIDAAVIMNRKVWEASGHASGFNDPMVECSNCHSRLREDHIKGKKCPICGKEDTFSKSQEFNMMFRTFVGPTWSTAEFKNAVKLGAKIQAIDPAGNITDEITIKDSNTSNSVAVYDADSLSYLRPETAQG